MGLSKNWCRVLTICFLGGMLTTGMVYEDGLKESPVAIALVIVFGLGFMLSFVCGWPEKFKSATYVLIVMAMLMSALSSISFIAAIPISLINGNMLMFAYAGAFLAMAVVFSFICLVIAALVTE